MLGGERGALARAHSQQAIGRATEQRMPEVPAAIGVTTSPRSEADALVQLLQFTLVLLER